MMSISIIPFEKRFSKEFKELNIAWLEKYFYVEPHDEEVLSDPEKYIITPGGTIFFIQENEKIIGTVALMKIEDGIYELTKMAITPSHQGKQLGQKLMNHAIAYAKAQKWKELILYSNRKLENAIYIYFKYGFKEIPIEEKNPYSRGDIKMKLDLRS